MRGATDGHSTIWLHRDLSQREARSTLAHEAIHLAWGHSTRQPPSMERLVRQASARWLLPDLYAIGTALASCGSLDAAADELWVAADTLKARLGALLPHERQELSRRLSDLNHP